MKFLFMRFRHTTFGSSLNFKAFSFLGLCQCLTCYTIAILQEKVGIVYISNRADCCWSRLSGFEIRIGNVFSVSKNPKCGIKYSLKRGETREILCNPPLSGRYVIISMESPRGEFLTLCEVAVYARKCECGNFSKFLQQNS